MKISPRQYTIALYEVVKDAKEKEEVLFYVDNFLKILVANNDLKLLNDIIDAFIRQDYQMLGIQEAKVILASPISEFLRGEIKNQLRTITGKSIIYREIIDPKILGGIVIKINDYLFDASLRTKINNLRKQLMA